MSFSDFTLSVILLGFQGLTVDVQSSVGSIPARARLRLAVRRSNCGTVQYRTVFFVRKLRETAINPAVRASPEPTSKGVCSGRTSDGDRVWEVPGRGEPVYGNEGGTQWNGAVQEA